MKIAFYSNMILEYGGGYEKYLVETASNLTRFNSDFKIDIITMDDRFAQKINFFHSLYYHKKHSASTSHKEPLDVIKKRLDTINYYKIGKFKDLKNKLKEYDLIYSKNEVMALFILKLLIGYENLPPVIVCCGSSVYHHHAKFWQSKFHNFMYTGFIYQYLASGVKLFQAKNAFDEKKLTAMFPNKKILKIYNAFNVDAFKALSKKYEYNFTPDRAKFNILWAGRLTESKGVDDLIEIINSLNRTEYGKKIAWNIAGDGEDRPKILNIAKNWNNINYLGYIKNKYMAGIYAKNSLFISTNHWDGCPNTVLEAQAIDMPVIAYDIPGGNDIIKNGLTGALVKSVDEYVAKIKNIIDGKERFANISDNIKINFNAGIITNQLYLMFKNIY